MLYLFTSCLVWKESQTRKNKMIALAQLQYFEVWGCSFWALVTVTLDFTHKTKNYTFHTFCDILKCNLNKAAFVQHDSRSNAPRRSQFWSLWSVCVCVKHHQWAWDWRALINLTGGKLSDVHEHKEANPEESLLCEAFEGPTTNEISLSINSSRKYRK